MEEYKVGDIVRWCWSAIHPNTYIIIEVDNRGALLKQNFGRGQVLTSKVPISELNGQEEEFKKWTRDYKLKQMGL
jgi:hypothetical protein